VVTTQYKFLTDKIIIRRYGKKRTWRTKMTNENNIHEEIRNRLHHGNISYYSRQIILSIGVTVGNVKPTDYNM
jgi:hypothetical protein